MNTKSRILVFAISVAFGFVVSLGVTMMSWEPFEDQAFHCTDRIDGIFWDSIDTHQAAGDTVLPGWTWQKIKVAQELYEAGFIVLWIGIAAAPALVPRRRSYAEAT